MTVVCNARILTATVLLSMVYTEVAHAQIEDIVVTARKRDESLRDAPLAITAYAKEDIERYQTRSLNDVAENTPSLIINNGANATGASITLRGVSTGTGVASFDQAISTNIDGVQISRGTVVRQGLFDMNQIEILKGPQALFFGKNSPGGIISIRTADPGKDFEAQARASYGFKAREWITEGFVSLPVSSTTGIRIAAQGRWADGHLKNLATQSALGSAYKRTPEADEYVIRGTIVSLPTDRLNLRAKLSYTHSDTSGRSSLAQRFDCPATSFIRAFEPNPECKADDRGFLPNSSTAVAALNPTINPADGVQFERIKSILGSFEGNYDLDKVKLTSVTGFYDYRNASYIDATYLSFVSVIGSGNSDRYRAISQELRAATQFDGMLNLTIGGYYQGEKSTIVNSVGLAASVVGPPVNVVLPPSFTYIHGDSYSVFGQVEIKLGQTLTLDAGGRYTHERKTFRKDAIGTLFDISGAKSFNNFSPETTLSWKPQNGINIYLSYREGFKSGGFDSSFFTPTNIDQVTFKPEKVSGFDGGIKTLLFDDQLAISANGYRFTYRNLQTSVINSVNNAVVTLNAAKARVQGIEGEFKWQPKDIPGLALRGSVSYNHARYVSFISQCYGSQTIAMGCNLNPNAGGVFTAQDLSGRTLPNAPEWSGNLGASYERPVSRTLSYGLTIDGSYSGSYQSQDVEDPRAVQSKAFRLNASVRLYSEDHRWEIALIGKNLTNVIRSTFTLDEARSISGRGTATANPTDLVGYFTSPREFTVQGTVKF